MHLACLSKRLEFDSFTKLRTPEWPLILSVIQWLTMYSFKITGDIGFNTLSFLLAVADNVFFQQLHETQVLTLCT